MALPRKLTAKIYEIRAHNGSVSSLDLGETGRVLVTGGHDRNVNLWAIGEETCFMSLTGHNRPIECVRFAYNDDFVYSADDIGIIRRWDLNAQTICSTLNGHMKGVRTLDFNPSGEYVVSGSNDTTVRLWDVRNQNKCIKVYRGHVAAVNSVQFSPDGLWIASAGSEGSVIIWDIRKSKQIMDFIEPPPVSAVTCLRYHPFEFLLAVGRLDGTVGIYDLESRTLISKTDTRSYFYGKPIKCITFSENGECLFVGTEAGISVIGWEPDREFDHIKSAWTKLGDLKIVNRRLIIGSYDQEYATVNALSIDRVFPFYNPSNTQAPAFMHNATNRKSFSRGNQKLRLSLVPKNSQKPSRVLEENEDNRSPSLDGQSSPNLSLELVDEQTIDVNSSTSTLMPSTTLSGGVENDTTTGFVGDNIHFDTIYNTTKKVSSPPFNFGSSLTSTIGYSSLIGSEMADDRYGFDGPSSLKMPGERDIFQFDRLVNTFNNEFEYNMNDSNPPIITNYDHNEMVEDFPVNQNLHQQPTSTSATVVSLSSNISNNTSGMHHSYSQKSTKSAKTSSNVQKRSTQNSSSFSSVRNGTANNGNSQVRNKLSHQVSSMSTTDLHKMDDSVLLKKSASSNIVNKGGVGSRRITETQSQLNNKENARGRNITVQIITKPPTRSRTSLELRSPPHHHQSSLMSSQRQSNRFGSYNETSSSATTTTNIPVSYRVDPSLITTAGINQKGFNSRNNIDDSSEIEMLSSYHEQVYQELSNRHATLLLIRNSTRSHDIIGALKHAIKINGRSVFVDLLGAILEKTSSWNLDLCLILLPEIYELLQSPHKFHYTRACDTLRVILSNFLPIIQENLDPWAANGLGVDVSREERQRKCIECQRWLLQIRSIPESNHLGTALTQLQNMIVNI